MAILVGCYKYEVIRYKLIFGYVFGFFVGIVSLFFLKLETAAIIATVCGLLSNARMAVNVRA
jgi:hypothetical protein